MTARLLNRSPSDWATIGERARCIMLNARRNALRSEMGYIVDLLSDDEINTAWDQRYEEVEFDDGKIRVVLR